MRELITVAAAAALLAGCGQPKTDLAVPTKAPGLAGCLQTVTAFNATSTVRNAEAVETICGTEAAHAPPDSSCKTWADLTAAAGVWFQALKREPDPILAERFLQQYREAAKKYVADCEATG